MNESFHPDRDAVEAIVHGDYGDVFAVLGMHAAPSGLLSVRVFFPGATSVAVLDRKTGRDVAELTRIHEQGFFSGLMGRRKKPFAYLLRIRIGLNELDLEDPYRFPLLLRDEDLILFSSGEHHLLHEVLGARAASFLGVAGALFAVWAPDAGRVSVVGDFNNWDGRRHTMRFRHKSGVWELFVPGLVNGDRYMFEIKDRVGDLLPLKADPFAYYADCPPERASVFHTGENRHDWRDMEWMQTRGKHFSKQAPVSIYEVHLGSWRRKAAGGNPWLSYRELADRLVGYVQEMGFTHLQLMPVSEFPYDGSWGYQPTGLYAPTSRFGKPSDFQYLVDTCHQKDIGVLLDWVPGHFPADDHGLARFDGTRLYEHADPRRGVHPDWQTLIYNLGRHEVANFLAANALFWLDRYHLDGLRVDAVASMLYLDYSREPGQWVPNKYGHNVNLESLDFLRRINTWIQERFPDTVTVAEESTAWPGVSQTVEKGGLGFSYKWNMGWMNDTLAYMKIDPLFRKYHHHKMTFGMTYAYSENFILPLSHDEVVHLKGSLLGRMPGDQWRRFANLRAYFGFMWTHPGKKLLFMGGELAQEREWNYQAGLDWPLLKSKRHSGVQTLVRDLNRLYRETPALHVWDCDARGFQWVKADEAEESYLAYLRLGPDETPPALVVCNFTPVPRIHYRFGVPRPGFYAEVLNTDRESYCGSNMHNGKGIHSEAVPSDGQPHSVVLTLPPLATAILIWERA